MNLPLEPNWSRYLEIFLKLPDDQRRVATAIGISEAFLMRARQRAPPYQSEQPEVRSLSWSVVCALTLWARCGGTGGSTPR